MALALLVASTAAFGQAQRGTIEVNVTDADGQAVPGASVSAVSDETLTRRTVFTDETGRAQVVALDPANNYEVTVSLEGFATQKIQGVLVSAGSNQSLSVTLSVEAVSDELIVTAEAPLVDVTKTQSGQNITLELTESLPTARSYQDYLQLVPGVQDSIDGDSPASRSGVNYSDRLGSVGNSTDNLYYFDGINVTDRTSGTTGADLNTEIIQEQAVLTGAIPAEYVGAPGLISNVVTKSGGNQFSGSVNYYLQDDSLVEDNDNFADDTFSTFDTAFTLGGPIVTDKAWFFTSFRIVEEERDVVDRDGNFLRTPTQTNEQAFAKLTWAISDSDVLSGTFLNDPVEQDGSFNRDRPNSADLAFDQGGERYIIGYNRVWGAAAFELAVSDHEADLNNAPINRTAAREVTFRPGSDTSNPTLGGAGQDNFVTRSNDSIRGAFEYLFDSSFGDHAVKIGYDTGETSLFENQELLGDPQASWLSISSQELGTPVFLCEIVGTCSATGDQFTTVEFGLSPDDFQGFRANLSAGDLATLTGLWDDDGDGFLSDTEITDNMVFLSSAGNPDGQINYTRDLQTSSGDQTEKTEFWQAFIQDSWQWNKWSVNAGIRAEQWDHFASTGDDISDFDTAVGPRVSVAYDLKGDGRSSIGAYYGRYYDAVRNNMTDFAGSLTGRIIEEQVWVEELQAFTTFRIRGGLAQQDGFFAPRIETPYTDEIQVQYKQDLGQNMMFEVNLIDRETADIMEDYGNLYYDPDVYAGLGGDLSASDSLFLGPAFFGFPTLNDIPTNLNFIIGTLPPEAFRDWQGVELIFRKRYSDNWQMLASYNYADAEANSNSDSNADGAGDVFFLDPRAPGRTGIQPGLVEHLFKVSGSYNWDNGFQVGGSYRWNSGAILNRSGTRAFNRNLPDQVDVGFPSNGLGGDTFFDTWIADDAIGFIDGSDYGTLDARVAYLWNINDRLEADFFLDIFNVFDDQQVIRVQDLVNGNEGVEFLDGLNFVAPRRYFVGARLRF